MPTASARLRANARLGRESQSRSDLREREEIRRARVRRRLSQRGPDESRRFTDDHDGRRLCGRDLEAGGREIAERHRAGRVGSKADEPGEGSLAGQTVQDLQLGCMSSRSDQVVRNVGPVGRLIRRGAANGDELPEAVAAI